MVPAPGSGTRLEPSGAGAPNRQQPVPQAGHALANFAHTLPAPQSELAQQIIKDPYNFDFLTLGQEMVERDLERGLLEHIRALILELGKGFAFVGSQYPLEVGGQDY
jgi:predicted nuclease of restriction endonuclease-like (RecB) superfamily